MAQWKRAGPITQRSEDQNLALLTILFYSYSGEYVLAIPIKICRRGNTSFFSSGPSAFLLLK